MTAPTRYRIADNQTQRTLGGNILVVDPDGPLIEYKHFASLMTTQPAPLSKTVILVSGFARAGKDTFADGLLDRVDQRQIHRVNQSRPDTRGLIFYKTSFAYSLKSAANEYLKSTEQHNPDLGLDFFDEQFKSTNRDVLVALGRMSRSLNRNIFAELTANRIARRDFWRRSDEVVVVPDWRYINELKVLTDILTPLGWRVLTVRIDTQGVEPANDEELQSLAEIRREVAVDFEYRFAFNSRDTVVDEGRNLADRLGL